MNTKKLLLLLTTSLVLGISLICKDPQPAQAKCKSSDFQCRLQKAGREVDPTNPQSGTREILRNVDPTKIRVEVGETPTSTFDDPTPSNQTITYIFTVKNSTENNMIVHTNIKEESPAADRVVVLPPGESKVYAFTQPTPAVIKWSSSVDNYESHTYVMPLNYRYPSYNRFISTTNGIKFLHSNNAKVLE
jgi:hypothetical protein